MTDSRRRADTTTFPFDVRSTSQNNSTCAPGDCGSGFSYPAAEEGGFIEAKYNTTGYQSYDATVTFSAFQAFDYFDPLPCTVYVDGEEVTSFEASCPPSPHSVSFRITSDVTTVTFENNASAGQFLVMDSRGCDPTTLDAPMDITQPPEEEPPEEEPPGNGGGDEPDGEDDPAGRFIGILSDNARLLFIAGTGVAGYLASDDEDERR
jgi:hypothetical protein